jgi:hypothetical protein
MNCFNHPDVPAVGICKACQKGLCMECAIDLGHGIACKNHREDVEMLNTIQADSKRAIQNTEVLYRVITVFILGIAVVLGGFSSRPTGINDAILIFGGTGICFLSAIYSISGHRYLDKEHRMKKARNK